MAANDLFDKSIPERKCLLPVLLFFLVFINNISKNLTPGTKIRLFADDSLLYRTIKSSKDCEILQKDLHIFQFPEVIILLTDYLMVNMECNKIELKKQK